MTFIAIFPASYPTDPFFIPAIVGLYIFLFACAGLVLGSILVKKVKIKFMIIGSVVYWVFTCLYWTINYVLPDTIPSYSHGALFWSAFIVLFADITCAVRYIGGKRRKQPL